MLRAEIDGFGRLAGMGMLGALVDMQLLHLRAAERAAGIQYSRSMRAMGEPGPTRVRISFSAGVVMGTSWKKVSDVGRTDSAEGCSAERSMYDMSKYDRSKYGR